MHRSRAEGTPPVFSSCPESPYADACAQDDDALETYKIKAGNTVHMVKGAAPAGASTGAAPQALPTMQTGQSPTDPLTQLNSHRAFGALAGFNPFADMGLNPNDPNMVRQRSPLHARACSRPPQMQNMMDSPQFLQQMTASLQDPAVIDRIIAMNPQLAAMGPQVREMFQSERFRQML
jgi:ubiquilin